MRRPCQGCRLALIVTGLLAPAALAHGGNSDFRSEFRPLLPACPASRSQVLNYDDRLLLINRTGKTVIVQGYEGEPYARLRGNGTVEVNRRSPSHYLNEERYGGTPVPRSAHPDTPPQWSEVSSTGRFETHDHRIHWMSKGQPHRRSRMRTSGPRCSTGGCRSGSAPSVRHSRGRCSGSRARAAAYRLRRSWPLSCSWR